jgi:hypothetical protein
MQNAQPGKRNRILRLEKTAWKKCFRAQVAGVAITLLYRIREMLGSNLGQNTAVLTISLLPTANVSLLSNLLQLSFIHSCDAVHSRYWHRLVPIVRWCSFSVCVSLSLFHSNKTVWSSVQVEIPRGVVFYFLAVPTIRIALFPLSSTNSKFSLQRFRGRVRLSFGKKNRATSWVGVGVEMDEEPCKWDPETRSEARDYRRHL